MGEDVPEEKIATLFQLTDQDRISSCHTMSYCHCFSAVFIMLDQCPIIGQQWKGRLS